MPGIRGLNFVIGESLGGGGVASLRIDPQVRTTLGEWSAFLVSGASPLVVMKKCQCTHKNYVVWAMNTVLQIFLGTMNICLSLG